ncbi:MAG: S8 family serine peptidase [Planctomycetota bacterium]
MDDLTLAARCARSRSRAYLARLSSLAQVATPTRALLLTLATAAALQAQEPQLERTLVRSDRGPAVEEIERAGPRLLRLNYATFDPLVADPVEPALAGASNLYIVQFVGLPTEDWRAALRASGATIHSYLPDHAYVVRMPQAIAQKVGRLPFVRWLGSYAPAFRLEPQLAAALAMGEPLKKQRYNVVVCDKHADKPALQARIQAIGGTVDNLLEGSILVEATLDAAQLRKVAAFDEVLWIDVWTPPELDMDNARIQGGGNFVESVAGYTGSGVRGHIYEGVEFGHPDFNTPLTVTQSCNSAERHGHCTAGIVFGNGTSAAQARGMAPDAVGFFTNYSCVNSGLSRNAVINAVVNTNQCMFTTASWGSGRTRSYTSISADADDVVFDHRIPWTQSQSNAGNQDSRPQAWAKNVISIGGVDHFNDSNAANDSWLAGNGSTGPASDGRIKPDLCAYYDSIWASDLTGAAGYSSGNSTTGFGGTSGATPIVAGHNALLVQMYTDDLFGNGPRVVGGSRFQNRPFAQTLKALQIVGARPYAFTASSTDNRREHQGWGFPSLQDLYESRAAAYVVPEDDVLTQGQTAAHTIAVGSGTPRLKVCMTFVEPAGNPAATLAIVNNLDLRVTSPTGTVYWGNNGLNSGNTSTAGGSANTIDSVECVFVDSPAAGNWTVEVIAQAIVTDAHVATGATDASYALAVLGGTGTPGGGGGGPGPVIDAASFETGFDSWSNASGDDLDWTRRSGTTPSVDTGPTAAQEGNTYVYVESSGSGTGYPTKTAILDGPTISMSGTEQIVFHYHMYGASMGTLQLQAVSSTGGVTNVWSRTGDQGNSWFQATVDLSSLGGAQQLRFVATTGTSWQSDFAVDNIVITGDGSIGGGGGGASLDVDFEAGFGGLANVAGDTHDWTRNSGGTPSNNTGPTGAAEGTWYAYVEASSPNIGTNAKLDSGLLPFAGGETLTFRYHMFGGTMGTLNVQAVSSSGAVTTLWSRTGDQGNVWQTANVPLTLSGDYRIRFDAQLGSSWESDICIDSVSIGTGGGGGGASFAANMESGFGALANETGDTHEWSRNSGGTPSSNTGPSGAVEGSWYAYVEASSPNIGTNARLATGLLDFDGTETLTFRYHMFGGTMGTLNVQAVSSSGAVTTLWTRSGDQGDVWQAASIPITLTGSYRIRFDAQLGSSWESDICIDDVVLQ